MTKPLKEKVPLYKIRLDGGTQFRAGPKDFEHLKTMAAEVQDGKKLKPVELCYDGKDYWTHNGHYRVEAYRMIYQDPKTAPEIDALVTRGSRAMAQDLACKANAKQDAKQRTRADLKNQMAFQLKRHPKWPDGKIARACAASKSRKLVAQLREELGLASASCSGSKMRVVERGGKTFDMDASNIGRSAAMPGGAAPDDVLGKRPPAAAASDGQRPATGAKDKAAAAPGSSKVRDVAEPVGFWLALPDDLAQAIDAAARRKGCNREKLAVPVCLASLQAKFGKKANGRKVG